VAWTASGQLLTVCAREPRLQAWEVTDGVEGPPAVTPSRASPVLGQRAVGLGVGPGSAALVLLVQGTPAPPGAEGVLVAVDPATGLARPSGGAATGVCLAAAPDDGSLAVGAGARVELLTPDGRRLARLVAAGDDPLAFHVVAASSRLVAAASQRATDRPGDQATHLVVWQRGGDPAAPLVVRSMTRIGALATSPRDPDALHVGWASGAVTRLRPLEGGQEPEHLAAPGEAPADLAPAHRIRVRALAFSRDGLRLVSAAGDDDGPGRGELRWWRLPPAGGVARPLGALVRLARVPAGLAVSPDGRWLAVGTTGGVVEVRAAPE